MLSEEQRIAYMNVPAQKLRLVIDTDTMNEVDDQFAIAWAAASKDRFDLEAVYAAPFSHDCFRSFNEDRELVDRAGEINGHSEDPGDGMEQSYAEIRRILTMMGEPIEGRVFRGSERYLPDRSTPVDSPAARDLIRRAMQGDGMLYVAAIATLTNIASAILLEPAVAEHMTVVWLGGHQLSYGHGIEFNLIQDVFAAQIVLNSGVPMIWVPCNNVAALLTVTEPELKCFMENNGTVSDYLAKTVLSKFCDPKADVAMMKLCRTSSFRDNIDQPDAYLDQFPTSHIAWSRIIWDAAAIAALKNPGWTPSRLIPAPVLTDDFRWLPAPAGRHAIRVVNYCYRNMIFGDMFAALAGK